MTKKALDKIAGGLKDAIAIARGEADRKSYRVHMPAEVDVGRIRRKLRQVCRVKDAPAGAGDAGLAGKTDGRHAHPQSIAGGGDAVEGKRVERNVDLLVAIQIFTAGRRLRHDLQPVARNARRFKSQSCALILFLPACCRDQ